MKKIRFLCSLFQIKSVCLSVIWMGLFLGHIPVAYSQTNQGSHQVISVNFNKARVTDVFALLEKEYGYNFVYKNADISTIKPVSIQIKNGSIEQVMAACLKGSDLESELTGKSVLIKKETAKPPRDYQVKGKISDNRGEPLPGASIVIKGTTKGVASDQDGNYMIDIKSAKTPVLVISFIGMAEQHIPVTTDNQSINVILQEVENKMDEVVVTGYQTLSKERATGSFSVISSKEYGNKLQTNVLDRLEGLAAGLVTQNNEIQIRGVSTLYGNKTPLYVVDGMPYEGDIEAINPSDVINITVLKDAAAASIYGARAANGVIVITTKRGEDTGSGRNMKISYSGSVKFTPLPDLNYLNLLNSSELVDMQIEEFKYYHNPTPNIRNSMNEVKEILYQHEKGEITDTRLEEQLNYYRGLNNRNQIKDEFLRTAVKHQHNLSLTGGNKQNMYLFSLNYTGDSPYQKSLQDERVGFNLKDNIQLTKWLKAELNVSASFTKSKGGDGIDALGMYTSGAPYNMLRDEKGNPRAFRKSKSDYELERLTSIGLLDETYIPVNEINQVRRNNKSAYYRAAMGFNVKLIEGLTVDMRYQNERTSITDQKVYDKNSYTAHNMVNDAAKYDANTRKITYNVPIGGQLKEYRGDVYAYTLRVQANYNKQLKERHMLTALLGAERRAVKTTGTNTYLFGYDDNSLSHKPINPLIMTPLSGTQSLGATFNWDNNLYNNVQVNEDRFVSFYGNTSYTYNNRYALTGSVRIDQSNLFGTDPKYQYKPLWSVGANWYVAEESFLKSQEWLNRLNLRVTYGINGNISKKSGPYLTVENETFVNQAGDFGGKVSNPPNPMLRWEKTAVTNIGIDFAVLKSRLKGSIDYYNKKSTDLLGNRAMDPTTGWNKLLLNFGSMYNRGCEVTLNSSNIQLQSFQWTTTLNFSYNKNKIINIENTTSDVQSYLTERVDTKNHPTQSLFSTRWAGLDPRNGNPMVYNENNEKTTNITSIDALEYSGTTVPPYSLTLSNRLTYKGLSLSFMFIYNGGHVLRDDVDYLTGSNAEVVKRNSLNYWKKAGDETISGMAPSMNRSAATTVTRLWYAADIHVVKADYIKLRELALSYTLPTSISQKICLENLSVNLQVNDLWKWTANDRGIDPEAYAYSGSSFYGKRTLPRPTTWALGLSVNF